MRKQKYAQGNNTKDQLQLASVHIVKATHREESTVPGF